MGGGRSSEGHEKKLLLTITSRKDAPQMLDAFAGTGFPAMQFGSTGGFLRAGNVTILSGVDADHVDRVIAAIQQICDAGPGRSRATTSAREHGRVVFVVDVMRMDRG